MDTTRQIEQPASSNQHRASSIQHPASSIQHPRSGFTLVELLVVITIIGILAGLITVAAVGALKKARETEIKTEINQIDTGFMEYKNKTTAFPPNCQTDGSGSNGPLDEASILSDLKRHMNQVAGRHLEPDTLIARLAGLTPAGTQLSPSQGGLQGGMSAGEAVVFWLGGFSEDPKYPISGEGGPSYRIDNLPGGVTPAQADPIESRSWIFPFDVGRLGPRDADGYFDESVGRFIEYQVVVNGQTQTRRINFWQYTPRKSQQPYLYFDTSRHPAAVLVGSDVRGPFDPPAATELSQTGPDGMGLHVHAFKKANQTAGANVPPIQFVDPQKFQVMHCGLDEAWDEESFERMSAHGVEEGGGDPKVVPDYLLFPTGPFTGEVADTIVNFIQQTRIEDAAP